MDDPSDIAREEHIASLWQEFVGQTKSESAPAPAPELAPVETSAGAQDDVEARAKKSVRREDDEAALSQELYQSKMRAIEAASEDEALSGRIQDREERLRYARHLFRLISFWLIAIVAVVVLDGLGPNISPFKFNIPDGLLVAAAFAYVLIVLMNGVYDSIRADKNQPPSASLSPDLRETMRRWANLLGYSIPLLVLARLADVRISVQQFNVPDNVLVALAVTTTATVIGLFSAVAYYLFSKGRSER